METQLRKLQLAQLEILKLIDQLCRENDIKYSLYAGTLLGAARHKGFIPWDDDLDICMERSEYNRFIKVWEMNHPKGHILQNKENSPKFSQSFTKIRKEHTTFLQYEWERNQYHTGIFVDIFPIDRFPKGKLNKKLFKFKCMLYQLYTREFVPSKAGSMTKLISSFLLNAVPTKKRPLVREKLLDTIIRNNSDRSLKIAAIETMASLKVEYPADMLDSYTYIEFEDGEFMCFSDWDTHLKCKFKDYMTLPPEEEREWRHHPIILDFDKSLDELN